MDPEVTATATHTSPYHGSPTQNTSIPGSCGPGFVPCHRAHQLLPGSLHLERAMGLPNWCPGCQHSSPSTQQEAGPLRAEDTLD